MKVEMIFFVRSIYKLMKNVFQINFTRFFHIILFFHEFLLVQYANLMFSNKIKCKRKRFLEVSGNLEWNISSLPIRGGHHLGSVLHFYRFLKVKSNPVQRQKTMQWFFLISGWSINLAIWLDERICYDKL